MRGDFKHAGDQQVTFGFIPPLEQTWSQRRCPCRNRPTKQRFFASTRLVILQYRKELRQTPHRCPEAWHTLRNGHGVEKAG